MYPKCKAIPRFVYRCAAIALSVALATADSATAQAERPVPAGFQALPLKYAAPNEIALQLRRSLSPNAQILVDQSHQRVLIQGPPRDRQLAQVVVANLDRPPANGLRGARAFTPADGNYLRRPQAFELAAAQLDGSETARSRPPADQPVTRRLVQLRHISWREFEGAVQRVWGKRLQLVPQGDGDVSRVTFSSPQRGTVQMQVDRKRNQVYLQAPAKLVDAWEKAISAIDRPAKREQEKSALVRLGNADPAMVRRAVSLLQSASDKADEGESRVALPLDRTGRQSPVGRLVAMLFQPPAGNAQQPPAGQNQAAPEGPEDTSALFGNVKIQFIEGLDIVVITGRPADVERVRRIMEQIQAGAQQTQPEIRVHHLRYIDSRATSDLLVQLYEQVYATRQGPVSITALVKPNALLLVGRVENVKSVLALLHQLDQPVPPKTQFEVFQLKYMSAVDAETRLLAFYQGQAQAQAAATATANQQQMDLTGLAPRVRVVADYRSNALIVQASRRDMDEVKRFIRRLDVEENLSLHEVQIFQLVNSLATDLAPVLQDAISGQLEGAGRAQSGTGALQPATSQNTLSRVRSTMLSFLTVGGENGDQALKSGILFDVRVVPDTNSNSLIVVGPTRSMPLMKALINTLDQLPKAEAKIKVFTVENGDVTSLAQMLQQLFGQEVTAGTGAFGQAAFLRAATAGTQQVTSGGAEGSLVPLRFAIDQRTNSIIASGSTSDLIVVETILARLDESGIVDRKFTVYKLRNTLAQSVADSITQLLNAQSALFQTQFQTTGILTPFEQFQREVFVVPEAVTNSLIISASPRFYDEVLRVIEDLDARRPMVVIQCLIAEIQFDDVHEFGIEAGIQDSLVFDRGIGLVGFPFNQAGLGNNSDALSLSTREHVAGQALSFLNVGRLSGNADFGGLVLTAGNESVNVLLRALKSKGVVRVLSRPQLTTQDSELAQVQVGAAVSRITGSGQNQFGNVQNSVVDVDIGLIMQILPRVSTDGMITMTLDVENSSLGNEADGTVIAVDNNNNPIRSPQINRTFAQATLVARSGQTVVLSGLQTRSKSYVQRGVPFLSDLPVLGLPFRFEAEVERSKELLIIMTPYIIQNDEDYEWLKTVESARMHWILSDVVDMHGDVGLSGREYMDGCQPGVIYPELQPSGDSHLPTPAESQPAPIIRPTPISRWQLLHPARPQPAPIQRPDDDRSSRRFDRSRSTDDSSPNPGFDGRASRVAPQQLIRDTMPAFGRDQQFDDRFNRPAGSEGGQPDAIVPAAFDEQQRERHPLRKNYFAPPTRLPTVN